MVTVCTKTGIGNETSIQAKVRIGLSLCKTNCVLNCGNCPYVFLKDENDNDISGCTSALARDTEECINSLLENSINFILKKVIHTVHSLNIDIEEKLVTLLIHLPDPLAAHSKERFSYLYQGGKWTYEDDGLLNDDKIFNGNE